MKNVQEQTQVLYPITKKYTLTLIVFMIIDEIIFESKKLHKNHQINTSESINMMYSLLMNDYEVKPKSRLVFKQMLNKIAKKGLLKHNDHLFALKRLFIKKRNNNFSKSFRRITLFTKAMLALKKVIRAKRVTFQKKLLAYTAILQTEIAKHTFGVTFL